MEVPPPQQILEPAELRRLAAEVMASARFPDLATIDGDHPRVRPVSPLRTEGFTVYIASMRSSNKTAELERNQNVELCYMSPGHDHVRITGRMALVTDASTRQSIWDANPLLRAYLKSIDNPEFLLYVIQPTRVRYMKEWALQYHEVPFDGEPLRQ